MFSDCVIPGEPDGIRLAEEISRPRPGLPIVLTSGFDGTKKDLSFSATERPVPAKPYTTRDLGRMLAARV